MGLVHRAGDRFNRGFARVSDWYGSFTRRILHAPKRVLAIYAGLIALTVGCSGSRRPASSRRRTRAMRWPSIQLPPGSSIERTDAVLQEGRRQAAARCRASTRR